MQTVPDNDLLANNRSERAAPASYTEGLFSCHAAGPFFSFHLLAITCSLCDSFALFISLSLCLLNVGGLAASLPRTHPGTPVVRS